MVKNKTPQVNKSVKQSGYMDYSVMSGANASVFFTMLKSADPDLFFIKQTLTDYPMDAQILPPLIKSLFDLCTSGLGTGYGKLIVHVQNNVLTSIIGERNKKIDTPVVRPETPPTFDKDKK